VAKRSSAARSPSTPYKETAWEKAKWYGSAYEANPLRAGRCLPSARPSYAEAMVSSTPSSVNHDDWVVSLTLLSESIHDVVFQVE
jgi:hypothetical protein